MDGAPHVVLTTDRLLLRRLTEADVDHLYKLDSDPAVMRFINGGRPTPREVIRDQILPRLLHDYERFPGLGRWAAIERSGREFLGWCSLRAREGSPGEAELGYRLRRPAWGRGYGSEAARALVRRGFTELGLQRVFATTMAVNAASRRVMEKAGLTLVRTFHQSWPDVIEGSEQGDVEYALSRAGWEKREAGSAGRRRAPG